MPSSSSSLLSIKLYGRFWASVLRVLDLCERRKAGLRPLMQSLELELQLLDQREQQLGVFLELPEQLLGQARRDFYRAQLRALRKARLAAHCKRARRT